MQEIWASLLAFHINGASNLIYVLTTNWWFVLILGACICTAIMSWREKKGAVIQEEQNIL